MTVAISVTGTRNGNQQLSVAQIQIVEDTIAELKAPPDLWFTGGAKGVDTLAAACAIAYWPEAKHIILTPCWRLAQSEAVYDCNFDKTGIRKLRKLAVDLSVDLSVKRAAPGIGSKAAGYLRRDDMLAQNCTHMLAFPPVSGEQRRSGTWATVRRAKVQGRPVLVTPLDGSDPVRLASA